MRRTTSLAAIGSLLALPLGLGVATTTAHAAQVCDAKVATIVVTELVDDHTSAPVTGTPGDDVILGTDKNDTIDGGGGNDTICGLAGADTLVGGDGDDRLFGGADESGFGGCCWGDLLVPGGGDDLVDLGTGEDSLGEFEVDQVSYADAPNGVTVDLAAGTATGHGTDTIVDRAPGRPIGVVGSPYDDTLLGTPARDVIDGGAGDDTIVTGGGPDVVDPDSPGRTTSGWQLGNPTPVLQAQPGDDLVSTGAGRDRVTVKRGADTVRAGAHVDDLISSSPEAGTRLRGGSGNDSFFLDDAMTTTLRGQSGDDSFMVYLADTGGSARPTFDGGAGRDELALWVQRDGTLIDLLGVDTARGRIDVDGTQVARVAATERIRSSGRISRAVFRGGPHDDWFRTGAHNVRAFGGGGNDKLHGGSGADVLDGGPGRDILIGDQGRDRCLRGERLTSCERLR